MLTRVRVIALWMVLHGGVAPLQALAAEVVVPNAQANASGNGNNVAPFNCGVSFTSMRYQQVYAGTEVGAGLITRLGFRLRPGANGFGPTTLPGVTITLSSTPRGPGALSTTFAANIGPDVTTVFSGDLVLSSPGNSVPPFNRRRSTS